jgi:hypothetical protein
MAEGLPGKHRVTLGEDKGYDAHDFIAELRHMEITPHIAQNHTNRRSAVDERTTRHAGGPSQSEETQANRRGVRLDEEHRVVAQATASRAGVRRLDVHIRRGGLQLSAHPQPKRRAPQSQVANCPEKAPLSANLQNSRRNEDGHRKASYTLCRTPFFPQPVSLG